MCLIAHVVRVCCLLVLALSVTDSRARTNFPENGRVVPGSSELGALTIETRQRPDFGDYNTGVPSQPLVRLITASSLFSTFDIIANPRTSVGRCLVFAAGLEIVIGKD